MSDNIYNYLKDNFNIEVKDYQFKRDYINCPLKKTIKLQHGDLVWEKPHKEDLEYLYITLNLSQSTLGRIFSIKRPTIRGWIEKLNINKSQKQIDDSRKITCNFLYGCESNMCTSEFKEKSKKIFLERYGVDNVSKSDDAKNKSKQTRLKRYGDGNYVNNEKRKRTTQEKYGADWIVQTDEFKKKSKMTCLKKYGVEHPMKNNLIKDKGLQTQLKSGHWGKLCSKQENKIYELLCSKYGEVKRQYKSKLYPFRCDFYIPKLDLYIEYQGYFGHGG